VRFLLGDLWLPNSIHINKEAYHPACRSAIGTQTGNHQSAAGGQTQREAIAGKIVIGIDPAKDKHQAAVVDAHGNQRGASYSFPVSATGYGETLWGNMAKVVPSCNAQSVVFAIETACNLWETLAFYLRSRGYAVVFVSP
jgi:hypothetical protein